jgi:hypothetical protein
MWRADEEARDTPFPSSGERGRSTAGRGRSGGGSSVGTSQFAQLSLDQFELKSMSDEEGAGSGLSVDRRSDDDEDLGNSPCMQRSGNGPNAERGRRVVNMTSCTDEVDGDASVDEEADDETTDGETSGGRGQDASESIRRSMRKRRFDARSTGADPSRRRGLRKATNTTGGGRSARLVSSIFGVRIDADSLETAEEDEDDDDESEDESISSIGAQRCDTQDRRSGRQAFPVQGIDCIFCNLAHKIGPVDKYVNTYMLKMKRRSLWRGAASIYSETAQAARDEGEYAVDATWREVRDHYELHANIERLERANNCDMTKAMMLQVKQRLVRIDEDGSRELDHKSADQMMKLVALHSKETALLHACCAMAGVAGRGTAKGATRPGTMTGSDAPIAQ